MGRAELSSNTKAKIETLLKAGKSQNAVAKEVGCSPSAVNRLAEKRGIKPSRMAPKAAIQAKQQYDLQGRLELSNVLFDAIRDKVLEGGQTARDLKDLALAFGITTDKRRLEEGESTSRSESRVDKGGFDLEKEFAKLDELSADWTEPSENGVE